jgi:two-component system, LytTR family, response regulator
MILGRTLTPSCFDGDMRDFMSTNSVAELSPMKTLIVDHEPRVRANLRHLCEADSSIAEVAVAECGATALEMIRAIRPDLLLLDVELKDMTGFDLLHSLNGAARPAVIMVAAHDELEAEALRDGAIAYLTKPIDAGRFANALAKVHERNESALVRAQRRISGQARRRQLPTHLMGENAHRLYFVAVEDVDFIEACGNYVLIHVGDQKYVRRDTIKRLASALRDQGFEWVRRSTLINLARVAFAERLGRGALAFTLASGTRLVSRTKIKLEEARAGNYDDEP